MKEAEHKPAYKADAYRDAGVDIEAGAALVERIKPHVARTKRSGVMGGLGGFGALFDLKQTGYTDPVLVAATDGVGTKLKIAIDSGIHNTVGIDLVAMCVNDLVTSGAEPLFFLDYFASGILDVAAGEEIVAGIAEGCVQAGCALIGGETAEMPGMYAKGDYDLAGFSVGAVERDRIVDGSRIREGDSVLALASSGLHSNGFSLVRRIVQSSQGFSYDKPTAFSAGRPLGEFLLTPTRIYVQSLLAALKLEGADGQPAIRGMANITGGGLVENAPRMLPDGLAITFDASCWTLPPLFQWLAEAGKLSRADLATTLNCGIGLVIACDPKDVNALTAQLTATGETVMAIGKVTAQGKDGQLVTILNMEDAWPCTN